MLMPGRQYIPSPGSGLYRYGFNGKENDNEVKGEGNQQDYGMRIYDPRLGRFLSVDLLSRKYPELTPYQFASNRPVDGIDLDGMEWGVGNFLLNKTAQKQPTVETPQSCLANQQATSNSLLSIYWKGVKDSYSDMKQSYSISSLKETGNNIVGTFTDIGRMAIGKNGAAEDFSNRMVNLSKSISDPVAKPVTFIGTLQTRPIYANVYGMGYYSLQIGVLILSDRVFAEINDFGILGTTAEGNQIIRNAIFDGVRFIEADAEATAYMTKVGKIADYMPASEFSPATALIPKGASRATILEEALHHQQVKQLGLKYASENLEMLEVQAQDELLRIGEKEHWTKGEMDQIHKAKATWEKRLEGKQHK
jgi:RHS repeat-associated protein